MLKLFENCQLCPRNCKKNRRNGETGICGQSADIFLARAALHMWEEPCISGESGSGTVFFSGCSMHCVFCQNAEIANGTAGRKVAHKRLVEIFLELQEKGANNINLVTADHYVPVVAWALQEAKKNGLHIPIVYNTGSYVAVETLRLLEGLVDIYLPDFKYYDGQIAKYCAKAEDYPAVAKAAIAEMVRQTGRPLFFEKGKQNCMTAKEYNDYAGDGEILMKKGTIVRHLLLPGCTADSKAIIRYLLEQYGEMIYISIMNQYTPMKDTGILQAEEKQGMFPELYRRLTEEEYASVIDFAIEMGIENGFIQEGDTAQESFIPAFDYEGV